MSAAAFVRRDRKEKGQDSEEGQRASTEPADLEGGVSVSQAEQERGADQQEEERSRE